MTVVQTSPAEYSLDCAEMNHRIANNLALLASLIESDGRSVSDPAAVSVLETAQRRVHAIANLHRRLYLSGQTGSVHAPEFLLELGDALRRVFEDGKKSRSLLVRAEHLVLPVEHAAAIGVLVAELVSNACRHAYPGNIPGEIRVTLTVESSDTWCLIVEDDGVGMSELPRSPTAGSGLGKRIIESASRRLGSRHRWEGANPGTRFVLQTG